MTPSHQPTLTINLGAITQNWQKLNGLSALGSAAVIKANAYGLGMEACGVALRDAGATRFFVATLDEGRALRETLGEKPWIGVLEGLSEVAAFQKHALTPVLNTLEQVQGWRGQTGRCDPPGYGHEPAGPAALRNWPKQHLRTRGRRRAQPY